MNHGSEESGLSTPERKTDLSSSPPGEKRVEDVGAYTDVEVVSPEEEARLLRKLDIRIIPMICWIYLMNFMDRGWSPSSHIYCIGIRR